MPKSACFSRLYRLDQYMPPMSGAAGAGAFGTGEALGAGAGFDEAAGFGAAAGAGPAISSSSCMLRTTCGDSLPQEGHF